MFSYLVKGLNSYVLTSPVITCMRCMNKNGHQVDKGFHAYRDICKPVGLSHGINVLFLC
jgi:hypothetical protein